MTQAAPVLQSGAGGPLDTLVSLVSNALGTLASDVVAALPRILAGVIFLIVAAVGIKLIKAALGAFLARAFPDEPKVYRQFIVAIVMLFLWFGAGLSFLSVVGMEQIAASLGSAAGFLALGVSYALSNVIADVVAGVYLLRDEDFMPGDRVDIGGTVGTVQSIELRKTRLTVNDGEDTMVRNNAEIEKKWTKLDDVSQEVDASGEATDGDSTAAEDPSDEVTEAVEERKQEAAEEVAEETTDTVQDQAKEVADDATDEVADTTDNVADATDEVDDAGEFTDADVKRPDE